MKVPEEIINLLSDVRTFLQDKCEPPVYVSDRRLVKAVAIMQVSTPCISAFVFFSLFVTWHWTWSPVHGRHGLCTGPTHLLSSCRWELAPL